MDSTVISNAASLFGYDRVELYSSRRNGAKAVFLTEKLGRISCRPRVKRERPLMGFIGWEKCN